MEQRSVCLFLALKGLSAQAIHHKLTAVLGPDAIADSTLTKYLRQKQFPSILVDSPEEPATTVFVQAIFHAFKQQLFSSIRELAKLTWIPIATVHRHLTRSLGFVVKHLRWVPHSLTATQKTERVTLSVELLRQLCSIEHDGWQFIITLDESWF
jgi:hypothetical protein